MSQTAKQEGQKEQLHVFLPGISEEGHFVISDFQHPRKAQRQQGSLSGVGVGARSAQCGSSHAVLIFWGSRGPRDAAGLTVLAA